MSPFRASRGCNEGDGLTSSGECENGTSSTGLTEHRRIQCHTLRRYLPVLVHVPLCGCTAVAASIVHISEENRWSFEQSVWKLSIAVTSQHTHHCKQAATGASCLKTLTPPWQMEQRTAELGHLFSHFPLQHVLIFSNLQTAATMQFIR